MLSPTHLGIALASAVCIMTRSDTTMTPVDFVALAIGSIAPDIDTGKGTISKPSNVIGKWLPKGPKVYLDTMFTGLSKSIAALFGHRTVFHWPSVGILIISFGDLSNSSWITWFGWGYLVHTLSDFFTPGGVPLLGPFIWKSFSIPIIKTGSFRELLFSLLIWGYTLYFGFFLLPPDTQKWLEVYGDASINGILRFKGKPVGE